MIGTSLRAFTGRVFAAMVGGRAFLMVLVFVFTVGTQAIAQTMTAPNIISESPFLVDEGETAVATLTADDSDTTAGDLIWSKTGGADSGKFSLTNAGILTFSAAKDYEAPDDADANGTYEVTVQVSDGSDSDSADLVVTLENVVELTALSGPSTVDYEENRAVRVAAYSASSEADRELLTWSLSGADAGSFRIDEPGGVLRFDLPVVFPNLFSPQPDYEAPTDTGNDGTYEVTVEVSDGTDTVTLKVTVTITNLDEAGAFSLFPTNPLIGTVVQARLSDPDGVASGPNEPVWEWARSSDKSTWTAITDFGTLKDASGNVTTAPPGPNYAPGDADTGMYFRVIVAYTDGTGSRKTLQVISNQVVRERAPAPDITIVELVSDLTIPWDLAFTPDGTMLFTERPGKLSARLASGTIQTVTADFSDLQLLGSNGLLAIVVDHDFATNRRFYTCQSHTGRKVQIIAWTISSDYTAATRVADPLVGDIHSGGGGHPGCRLRIGPEGYLWIATGDGYRPSTPQDLGSLAGKILRVDVTAGDGAPGNPFSSRVYRYGHRDPQGLALRPGTTEMWSMEHGPNWDDEINLLVAGANYGWDPDGPNYNHRAPMTDLRKFPDALEAKWSSEKETLAISGGIFLDDSAWGAWNGRLAVAALKAQSLNLFEFDSSGTLLSHVVVPELHEHYGRLRTPMTGPDGALYVTTSNGTSLDYILKVVPSLPPQFSAEVTTQSVEENRGASTVVATVTAIDPEGGAVTYTLGGGEDARNFNIANPDIGEVRADAPLDYETKSSYTVDVIATDPWGLDDAITLTINVENIDELPEFPSATMTRSVAENTGPGVSIGAPVTATTVGAAVTYTLGGTDAASFDIVEATGQLQTKAALDYETRSSYEVTVTATNLEGSVDIMVTIDVTNVIELQPLAVTTCSGGMAGTYPCRNVDLMSFLALADIGGGSANDVWGWTDSSTGKEYAIMGRTNGTSFVDISDPVNPIYLGNLPPHADDSTGRDIKVYADHAFIVTEANNSGMQVFDLTQLRMVASPPATFSATAHYPDFSDAHNLAINEESGFAYAVGTNTCSGGLHMINIQTPTNPTSAACFSGDGYTHDAQCVIYDGPDLDHKRKEICFNSNEDTLTIVDVTNKAGPVMLSRTGYSGSRYAHQGWLTEDQVYFLLGDELDEANNPDVTNTRTYMWDVSDLDDPALIGSHDSTTTAIDHNQYVKGNYTYQSNYQAGLRILDITDIANGNLSEAAFFDVNPGSDPTNTDGGTWSNYPFFDSGIVIVSVIEQGLFILRPNLVDGVNPALSSAAVNGAALTLTYGEALDEGSRPAPGDFTVQVDGSGRSVSGVSVSGRVVTLTLASVVAHDETVTVSYSPGANPIRDAAGNGAIGLSNEPVANETPETALPNMWLNPTKSDPVASVRSEATYTVTFQGAWNTTVTAGGVPSGGHFTTLIGGVHNAEVTFLKEGGMATAGVEIMAELGGTGTLTNEVRAAEPNALSVLQGSAGNIGPTGSSTINMVTLTTDHPRVTLLSMVAPSPDWFVGVSGLSLLDAGADWLPSQTVNLYPWDAGTEEGTEFSLTNSATSPPETITSLRGIGKFSNERIATLTFTRQSVNTAPSFTGDTRFEADENQTAAGRVAAADPDSGDGVTYAITGGADASKFGIGETTGVLTFQVPPNYERAADVASADPVNGAGNNEYIVTVTATGGTGDRAMTTEQTITATVRNVEEAGTISFSPVGSAIRARLSDLDGGVNGATWQWARSSNRNTGWTHIGGATSARYTPSSGDQGMYLQATVSYDDAHSSGKQAQGISATQIAPPNLRVATLVSGLSIPWDIAFTPDGTMLFTQRAGVLSSRLADGTVQTIDADFGDLFASGETGLMGIVVDPAFVSNRRFYTCQGHTGPEIQVIAWTLNTAYTQATRVADPLVGGLPASSDRHGGCRLRFGPEGYLWIATGDAASGTLPQDLTSLGGKVLRVDASTGAGAPTNPFAPSRVYTYGHRNVQGLALRPGTSQMWSVEHGPSVDDEINRLVAGRNYGWNPVPGYNESVPMTDLVQFPDAVEAKWSSGSTTRATSGGIFLEGNQWGVWEGRLAVATLADSKLRLFEFTPDGDFVSQVIVSELDGTFGRLRTPMLGPDGALYVTTSNGGGVDRILRIAEADPVPVTLQLMPASIGENGGVSTVTASQNRVSITATTVTVSATAVSPAVAADFTLSMNKTLTITAGQTTSTGTVTITANDNTVDTPGKTVRVSGTATNSAGVTGPSDVTLTIIDDDDPPTVTLELMPTSIDENGGSTTVTARLDRVSSETTTVTVSATAVSPAVEGDFALSANKTLTITAGQTTSAGTVTITANNNDADTPNKTVRVHGTADNSHGVTVPADEELTITDDDAAPVMTLEVNPTVIAEAAGNSTVTVRINNGVAFAEDQQIALTFTGTASKGTDYTVGLERLTLIAGQSSTATTVTAVDDALDDEAETVRITARHRGGVLGAEQTITITDDDASPVILTNSTILVDENETAVATLTASDADRPAEDLTWRITGGADRNRFRLTSDGVLTFAAAEDYEVPGDSDGNGDYEVAVEVRDGANPVEAVFTIRLKDVDDTAPVLSSASVNGTSLTLTYGEALDPNSRPAASDFTVAGGNSARTVSNVAVSGRAVTLTLDPAVEHGETGIRVSYRPGTNPIQDAAGNDALGLSNERVTNNTGDTTAPTVSRVETTSRPERAATYAAGQEIAVTVTFSETVVVTGTPRLRLNVGGVSRTAAYRSGTGAAAVFVYVVADGESDTDGVSVEAGRLTLNGGTIRDGSNNNAVLDHDGLAPNSGHKVDGAGPDLAETGGAVVNGTTLTLTYDEALDGGSRPVSGDFTVSGGDRVRAVTGVRVNGSGVELTLDVGAEHGEAGILVSYTVPTGMGANPIRDVPGNDAEALSRESVTNETPDTTSPEVSILAISSNPGSDQTYAAGDEIEVTVTFSETVEVEGTPQLRLRVGSRTRTAGYLRGTDTAALVFGYEVADGDEDTDGVSIEANSLTLNGGRIRDGANNNALLTHDGLAANAGHKVDGVRPAFLSAAVDGASLTLTYGEALDGRSRPATGDFTVQVDGAGRSVSGVSVSGSVVILTLNPAVEHGETGIRVSYRPGTNPVQDTAGNDALGLSNESVTNTTGAPNTAPQITSPESFDVRENQAMVRRLAAGDTDPGDEVTGWSIVGGADRFQFSIASDTGVLSFRTAPDYEDPRDTDSSDPVSGAGDNEYVVTVEARSGTGARQLEMEQTIAVRVTDEPEPPGVPEAPTFSGETADSLQVSWSEPDNTGPAITDYDVQYRERGTEGFTDAQHAGPGIALTLADLKVGTIYEAQVRATNNEGMSDWSESGEGRTVTPLIVQMTTGLPPPVEGPFTVRFSFSETVRGFTRSDIETQQEPACTDNANNPVSCNPGFAALQTTDDRIFTTTVTPVTDGVAHNYTLTITVPASGVTSAVDNKPNEAATLEVRIAPPGVTAPISSIGLRGNAGNGQVTLSWNTPANTGGAPIVRYEYRYLAEGEEWSNWENAAARARGVTVENLINGTEYVFETRAVNALGKGPVETAVATPAHNTGTGTGGGGGGGGGGGSPPARPTVNTDPVITTPGPFEVEENQTRVVRIEADDTDPGDAIRSYAIAGGADGNLFSIVAHTGVLSFRDPPNFEAPADVGSTDPPSEAGDNEYIVVVRVASGPVARDRTVEQAFTVRVTDADRESPGVPEAPRVTLALEASLTVAWDEPENPGPPITDYDVQYREGTTGVFINAPHEGPGRTATLTGLEAATLYQVQVRARNEEGTGRWSEPGEGLTLAGPAAVLPFAVPDRGGISLTSQGTSPALRVGYGQVETDAGMTPPAGLAIFGSRVNGVLVSEAGVPASAAVLEGRIFAETAGPVRTGLAIANPNDTAATITFFFTDSNGIDSGHDTFTLGPREQIARFLDEEPFNGGSAMFGTFTFTSNQPVAVIALRWFVNERSEFLMTTLPVAPIAVPTTGTVYFPLFADGGGWTTQVVLVNPTYAPIRGSVQFFGSGSQTEAAAPATLTLADGRGGSAFTYAIPPRSATRLRTSNPTGPLEVGSVRAVPDPGQPAPSGVSIFAFQKDGTTVSEAGVPASTSGAAFRVYVEASGTPGQPRAVWSGIALTNTSDAPTTVSLELTDLDGTATGLPESLTIPASGHIARFIDEFFPALTTPFSGILRIASTAPDIAAVGLRLAINQRHDILVTTTPPADENAAPTASDLFFPLFVDSGGWTTQFILFSRSPGQTASGVIRFTGQDGQPLELSVAPTAAPTIP